MLNEAKAIEELTSECTSLQEVAFVCQGVGKSIGMQHGSRERNPMMGMLGSLMDMANPLEALRDLFEGS